MSSYRVTVSKRSKPVFSTDTESTNTIDKALKVYHELSSRFTVSQGYSVMIFEVTNQVLWLDPLVAKHRR